MNAFRKTIEAFEELATEANRAFSVFVEEFKAFCEPLKISLRTSLQVYMKPNSRIKHLALHSKKARVRKKNIKRLLKGGAE